MHTVIEGMGQDAVVGDKKEYIVHTSMMSVNTNWERIRLALMEKGLYRKTPVLPLLLLLLLLSLSRP